MTWSLALAITALGAVAYLTYEFVLAGDRAEAMVAKIRAEIEYELDAARDAAAAKEAELQEHLRQVALTLQTGANRAAAAETMMKELAAKVLQLADLVNKFAPHAPPAAGMGVAPAISDLTDTRKHDV